MTPDGKQLVSGSKDATARLWSLEEGALVSWIVELLRRHLQVWSLWHSHHVSPHFTKSCATKIHEFVGHTRSVLSVTVTPDGSLQSSCMSPFSFVPCCHLDSGAVCTGRYVVTGSKDKTVRVCQLLFGCRLQCDRRTCFGDMLIISRFC